MKAARGRLFRARNTVTRMLSAVPEARADACWLAFLAGAALLATRRKACGPGRAVVPQSAQTTLRSVDVHWSNPAA
jgi:hypothetical protein